MHMSYSIESPWSAVVQLMFHLYTFVCVSLSHNPVFPQQGRLRGPSKPRMSTTAPHFFVFMKKLQQRDGVEGRTLENVVHLGSYG